MQLIKTDIKPKENELILIKYNNLYYTGTFIEGIVECPKIKIPHKNCEGWMPLKFDEQIIINLFKRLDVAYSKSQFYIGYQRGIVKGFGYLLYAMGYNLNTVNAIIKKYLPKQAASNNFPSEFVE